MAIGPSVFRFAAGPKVQSQGVPQAVAGWPCRYRKPSNFLIKLRLSDHCDERGYGPSGETDSPLTMKESYTSRCL